MTDSDLVGFLAARLDEDERFARLARPDFFTAECLGIFAAVGDATHVIRHAPARVLREIAAKRAILAEHEISSEPEIQNIEHHDKRWNTGWIEHIDTGRLVYWCATCDNDRDYGHLAGPQEGCPTIRHLAAIYSDHPDYRQEWKP